MYRYYRVCFIQHSTNTQGLRELYFLDDTDNDLTTTVSGSPITFNPTSTNPSNLYDRNTVTYHYEGNFVSGNSIVAYCGFYFNSPVTVDKIRIIIYASSYITNLYIQYSLDGIEWKHYGVLDGSYLVGIPHNADITCTIYKGRKDIFSTTTVPQKISFKKDIKAKLIRGRTIHSEFYGNNKIIGRTTIKRYPTNTPVSRFCVLYSHFTNLPVLSTWSKEDGTFEFENLSASRFFVVAFDNTGDYNGEIITELIATPDTP